MSSSKIITIFGSSRPKAGEDEYEVARELGKLLATAGFTICNGGYGGTMEAAAQGAKEAGGTTIGVTMEFVSTQANPWIDKNIVVKTLIDRLLKLIELGEAYVVLRGATGTLLELAAVWELIDKKVMSERPIIVVGKFWSSLVQTLKDELSLESRVVSAHYVRLVETPEECVRILVDIL